MKRNLAVAAKHISLVLWLRIALQMPNLLITTYFTAITRKGYSWKDGVMRLVAGVGLTLCVILSAMKLLKSMLWVLCQKQKQASRLMQIIGADKQRLKKQRNLPNQAKQRAIMDFSPLMIQCAHHLLAALIVKRQSTSHLMAKNIKALREILASALIAKWRSSCWSFI